VTPRPNRDQILHGACFELRWSWLLAIGILGLVAVVDILVDEEDEPRLAWPPPAPGNLSESEYAFWRQVVPSPEQDGDRIVLRAATTELPQMLEHMWLDQRKLEERLADIPTESDIESAREAVADFFAKAGSQFPLDAGQLPPHLLLVEDAALDRHWQDSNMDEAWLSFHRAHSKALGILRLSRVGFDRSGRTALAWIDYIRGPLSGWGELALYRREGTRWTRRRVFVDWVY